MNKAISQGLLTTFSLIVSLNCFSQQQPASLEIPASALETADAALEIRVTGANANTGQVIASLFSSKENYLNDSEITITTPIDKDGNASFTFNAIASGTYAVSVIYDEDSNGEMNTGFMGIPSEAFGFSNNAKGLFGPPAFKKSSFKFPEQDSISIHLGKVKK